MVPLMSFAVSKMEETDGGEGGEAVMSQSERRYTVEEIGAEIENKLYLSTSRRNTNPQQMWTCWLRSQQW